MKNKFLVACTILLASASSTFAQVDVNLNLHHKFGNADFNYSDVYMFDGRAVSISRVQYYLSGFEFTHDGGQITPMPDIYVLGSANITSYPLGQVNMSSMEGIDFNLGVDSLTNHLGTSNWPPQHVLSSQAPTMDWSWPAGYFFFTISGAIDSNSDGTPNQLFQFHAIGDHILREVDGFSGLNLTGSTINLDLDVNVEDWLWGNNLLNVGFQHNGGPENIIVADNTNDETVFTLNQFADLDEVEAEESHIYADYSLAYAPTVYYNLVTEKEVNITVYDMFGKVVLEAENQNAEGNFFIRQELETGTYIMIFANSETEESFKFIVKN